MQTGGHLYAHHDSWGGWILRHRWLLLKAVVGVGLLIALAISVNITSIVQRIGQLAPIFWITAFVLLAAQLVVFSGRLYLMCRCANARFPLRQSVLANFELAFFTQVVPTQLAGDAVRILRMREFGISLGQGLTSVFLDRAIGLVSMAMIAPVMLFFLPFAKIQGPIAYVLVALTVGTLMGSLTLYHLAPKLYSNSDSRVARLLITASEAFRTLLRSPVYSGWALVISVIGHMFSAAAATVIAKGLGVSLNFLPAIAAMALVQVALLAPLSIGGWGVREGATIFVLGLFDISAENGLLISIMYGITTLLVGLSGGLVWFFHGATKENLREAVSSAQLTR